MMGYVLRDETRFPVIRAWNIITPGCFLVFLKASLVFLSVVKFNDVHGRTSTVRVLLLSVSGKAYGQDRY